MNATPHDKQETAPRHPRGAGGVPILLALAVLVAPPALLLLEPQFGHLLPGDSALARLGLAWLLVWAVLALAGGGLWWTDRRQRSADRAPEPTVAREPPAQRPAPAQPAGADMQLTTSSVLELVNQQWVTPLGHIRSAVDSLAALERRLTQCAPPAEQNNQQEPARSLQLMRHASHRLRISIENIIDFHEIAAGRLKRTDARLNLRSTGEDMVADWQTTAQRDGEVLQFIGYQDLPREIALDPQLLRRLLDRQLNEALCIGHLGEPAVTFQIEDEHETEGGDRIGRFRLTVDGRPNDSFGREALIERLEFPLSDSLGDLLVDDLIDIWIIRCVCKHLDANLEVLDTGDGRTGLSATFDAPIMVDEPEPGEQLVGKLCGVICASEQHRRAWQGNLASLGADIQVEPDFGQPVDMLFLDERIVERHHHDPAFSEWVALAGRVVGLASHLTIRGRPAAPLHWADFTLPLFVRGRALSASMERILDTADSATRVSESRLAPRPARSQATQGPASAAQRAAQPAPGRHALYSFAGRTALVIDDDPVYLAHLGQTLGELGFQVLEAANGKQALELADHEDIDIVFTDMHMPDITGAGVARILRKRPRHLETPIIAITANRQGSVHEDLLHSGIERVLTKPVTAGELLSAIGEFFPLEQHTHAATHARESQSTPKDPFLTRLLLDELPGYRRLLTERSSDPDALRHAAHKLRGAAACCRETALQERAGALESALDRADQDTRIRSLVDSLVESIDQVESRPVETDADPAPNISQS